MLVEATRVIYYGLKRRRIGERFQLKAYRHYKRDKNGVVEKDKDGKPIIVTVSAEEQFSPKSMMKVESEQPVKRTARKSAEPNPPVEPPSLDDPPSDNDGLGEPTGDTEVL